MQTFLAHKIKNEVVKCFFVEIFGGTAKYLYLCTRFYELRA
jgi:hypothetical protein